MSNLDQIRKFRDVRTTFRISAMLPVCALVLFISFSTLSQVPSPRSVLGFNPTDDKTIADWRQINDYFTKLDNASNKVLVREIGKTTNGKPLVVAFISSSDNIKNLEKYRRISAKLADPRTIKDARELNDLIKNGKTIVSISCSIHSTEIVASQMSMNLAYELVTSNAAETKEILDNTILLLIPSSNPDGIDIVADWYRKTLGTKSEGTAPPELYHHYAGHDNNRDWFMLNLAETQAITKLYWQQWFPQIVYDVHQQGPNGSRFTIPPFFDPPNPRIPPALLRDVGLIGYKMAADLEAQNVSGVATNASYDTWWHGGFRSAPYYHNSIGILSEAASSNLMSPTTITIDELKRNRGARGLSTVLDTATNFPNPWKGGPWRPADIAAMEMTASRGLLQMAAKFRPQYLRNFYKLGEANLTPKLDEPRAFVVPAGQPNAETISRFLEILMAQGVEVHRLTSEIFMKHERTAAEFHEMPLGSFIVFVNQPQKNNILSLFERQIYPDRRNAAGEAEVPYDVAGWTLPIQMGVEYESAWQIKDGTPTSSFQKIQFLNEVRVTLNLNQTGTPFAKQPKPLKTSSRIGLYKSFTGSMDEGWTRLVFDTFQIPYRSVSDKDFRAGNFEVDTIILPADPENLILRGLTTERYPVELTGGIGDAGIANLKKFVADGGKLICFDDSCELVIKHFDLPMKNVLTGLKRSEFYNPGSVVKLEVNTKHILASGMREETAAYFTNSSAFNVTDETKVKTVAQYAVKNALLSGWMLGEKYVNGKTALAEASYGKGNIILFAFRPQHRGQSWATFPLIFNSLER